MKQRLWFANADKSMDFLLKIDAQKAAFLTCKNSVLAIEIAVFDSQIRPVLADQKCFFWWHKIQSKLLTDKAVVA